MSFARYAIEEHGDMFALQMSPYCEGRIKLKNMATCLHRKCFVKGGS